MNLKVSQINGHDIDLGEFKAWLKALEGGLYSQCTKKLQSAVGYCCLGVAKVVLVPLYKQDKDSFGLLTGNVLISDNDPKWLVALQDVQVASFKRKDTKIQNHTVIGLNDDAGFTFVEIAKILRMKYERGVPQESIDAVAQHIYDSKSVI